MMTWQKAGRSTSTPHQPANARFVPSLRLNVGQCARMWGEKMRGIKGLSAKCLFFITYWNCGLMGS